jgi:hypothetical protein
LYKSDEKSIKLCTNWHDDRDSKVDQRVTK